MLLQCHKKVQLCISYIEGDIIPPNRTALYFFSKGIPTASLNQSTTLWRDWYTTSCMQEKKHREYNITLGKYKQVKMSIQHESACRLTHRNSLWLLIYSATQSWLCFFMKQILRTKPSLFKRCDRHPNLLHTVTPYFFLILFCTAAESVYSVANHKHWWNWCTTLLPRECLMHTLFSKQVWGIHTIIISLI